MKTDDILAIRTLVDRYSAAANRLDAKGMAAVYVEDGEVSAFGNSFKGRAEIERVFGQTIAMMEVMNQICSAGEIEIAGDRATAHWTVTEFAKRRELDKLELFLGDYNDELVRTPDGWRFAKRTLSRRLQTRFEGQLRV